MNMIKNKYLLAAQYNEEQCKWMSQVYFDNHNTGQGVLCYSVAGPNI